MRHLENEDAILVDRCRLGDRQAFHRLVDRHRDSAYRLAYRLTRNHDDAEDIVAESFVRVYRGLHAFSGGSSFSTWLYRIVTNCFLDTKRNPNKPKYMSLEGFQSEDGEEMELQVACKGPSPYDVAQRGLQLGRLIKALDRLPDSYRTIIVLYHADMLSYEEIADVLSMPIGTVKSRLNRARLAMRQELVGEELLFAA
ncbi:MAG TPA: sigma-70 family RNA polymerase sigma factor [Fimbriimonas sp.]